MTRRVVLIGATGEFGSRLAKLLAGLDGISLFLTAREAFGAPGLAAALKPGARCASITGMAFERRDAEAAFAALRPWLVVDASGPFQGMDYATARSAIDSGAHWIDLADAEDYLLGFAGALDAPSRASRVSATAGASSTPALSFAVVDDLTRDWRRVDTVDLA
ncbi:MAG: saccharopine dehydrogenase, partial [Hyphomicrobium sp.]